MVQNIAEFEIIVTDSELEALILECNLIKKHRPRYNILLKDDKSYPFIKVTLREDYPRVLMTRRVLKDGAKYFGPYTSSYAVKQTLEAIKRVYSIRVCNKRVKADGSPVDRPCLNFYIKQCMGPCTGKVSKESYRKMIEEIIQILEGKQEQLIRKLEEEMRTAAEIWNMKRQGRSGIRLAPCIRLWRSKDGIHSQSDQDIIAFARGWMRYVCRYFCKGWEAYRKGALHAAGC